jgi:hypothetical protein
MIDKVKITNNQDTRYPSRRNVGTGKQIPIYNNQSPNKKNWLLEFENWLLFGYWKLVIGY